MKCVKTLIENSLYDAPAPGTGGGVTGSAGATSAPGGSTVSGT